MPSSGLFITLYDYETLKLYLHRGIYGFLMLPTVGPVSPMSKHFNALGDYACARRDAHVFFFTKRRIIYGGQLIGSKDFGVFYLNGPYSLMGKQAKAKVYWDESGRNTKKNRYEPTGNLGIFEVHRSDSQENQEGGLRCQPYLILFKDKLGLKGATISSDQLYFRLGKYGYPLPSNSISGMGFCTLTPRETDIALSLLEKEPLDHILVRSSEKTNVVGSPIPFEPKYGIASLKNAFQESLFVNEAHLEASVLANPNLLPKELRPGNATICRQVPVSPFKPFQMDRADICYFREDGINDGTVPNVVIELKNGTAGKSSADQVCRYLKWFYLILGKNASKISVYLAAPSFATSEKESIPSQYRSQVEFVELGSGENTQTRLTNG